MNEIFDQVIASPVVTTVATAIAVALVALWLAAAWWAFADAGRRTDNTFAALLAAAWIVVSTPLLVPMSLAIYALARPQQTASELRTRRLAADLVDQLEAAEEACPTCREPVEEGWLRCPSCSAWLARRCAACNATSDLELSICPFCGGEDWAEAAGSATGAPAAARARRARRLSRAVSAGRPFPARHGQRPFAAEPRGAGSAAAPVVVR